MRRAHRKKELPVLQRVALEVRDAVRNEAADALLEAVHGVERADDERLLFAAVPHRRKEDEGGLADALEDTEERADDDETGEVLACCCAGKDCAPCCNAGQGISIT